MSEVENATGKLTLVATPIGNLADMTYRAVEVLRDADVILAEDTRHSRRLLDHYGIPARPLAYHDHNKERVTPGIVERLLSGEHVALVTDAGTPGISDPGFHITRAAIAAGIAVTMTPGANALLPALVLSGFPTDAFVFHGYTPRKQGELARTVAALADEKRTSVFFVAPHQLLKVLDAFTHEMPDRPLAIARELTKLHEEVVRGTAPELRERFGAGKVRGELVLVVHGVGRRRRA